MKVKDFFTTVDEFTPTNKSVPSHQHVPKNHSESAVKRKQITSPTKKMFTINIHVEKPDIILLEDMDDINSNCIILNVNTVYFSFFFIYCCICLCYCILFLLFARTISLSDRITAESTFDG